MPDPIRNMAASVRARAFANEPGQAAAMARFLAEDRGRTYRFGPDYREIGAIPDAASRSGCKDC